MPDTPRIGTRAYLLALTFLELFGPRIGGSFFLDTISLTSGWLVLSFWLSGRYRLPWAAGSHKPAAMLAGLSLYALIVALVAPQGELFYPAKFSRTLLNYVGVWLLCVLYRRQYGLAFAPALLRDIFWSCALHGAIMIVQYAIPAAGAVIVAISGYDRAKLDRVTGLTVSYNTLNIVEGFGLLIVTQFPEIFRGLSRWLLLPLGVCAIVGGMTLAGRTAMYLAMLCVLASLLTTGLRRIRNLAPALIATAVVISAGIGWLSFGGESADRFRTSTLPMLLGPFTSYFELGYLDEDRGGLTTRTLQDMYFLPESTAALIFGNSCSGRGDVYIASDAGFVLLLHGLGLVGLAAILGFYAYSCHAAWQLRRYDRRLSHLALMLLALIFAVSFKEQALLTRHAFTASAMMLGLWYLLRHDDARRLGQHPATRAAASPRA